jgi:hypothetical protein
MKAKTAEPMEEKTEETTEERAACSVCEQTFYERHGSLQLRFEQLICPFCAVYMGCEPRPALVPELDSDIELLGAWCMFAEDLIQWHLNVSWKYRQAKLDLDALLPEAITVWALGSLYDTGAQAAALAEMWPVLAYGRILKLTETAATFADRLLESPDVTAIRAALALPEVQRVWQLWLAANNEHGLSAGSDGFSYWYGAGVHHGRAYYEWRGPKRGLAAPPAKRVEARARTVAKRAAQ